MIDKDTVTLSDNPMVLGYDVEVCVRVRTCACVYMYVGVCPHVCVCARACVRVHVYVHMWLLDGNLYNLLYLHTNCDQS